MNLSSLFDVGGARYHDTQLKSPCKIVLEFHCHFEESSYNKKVNISCAQKKMTPFANLLLLISLSSTTIASSNDIQQQNDTSTEAVLDETGNVDLVDPRITIIDSKIKERR